MQRAGSMTRDDRGRLNMDEGEVGIDEAGRGCLFGPVCVGAVVMKPEGFVDPPYEIKDSKIKSISEVFIIKGGEIINLISLLNVA